MIDWQKPILTDSEWVYDIVNKSKYSGSDAAFANIFLLRDKYNIKIAEKDGYLFRYYEGSESRTGFTFPLGDYSYGLNNKLTHILQLIEDDSVSLGRKLEFTLVSDQQLALLKEYYGERLLIMHDSGDDDYIYNQNELASLSGRKFHKKKNHVSRFIKSYNDIRNYDMSEDNLSDALMVEEEWLKKTSHSSSSDYEYRAIMEAIDNFQALRLSGTVTYIAGVPAAMTIYSYINESCADIHFEKSYGDYAELGAFAYINQENARKIRSEYINREEDINIEGLRKAKESYHPRKKLIKYHVTVL